MSERADRDLLRDIREAVQRISLYTDAMTYDRFLADIKTQDIVSIELPELESQIEFILQQEQSGR